MDDVLRRFFVHLEHTGSVSNRNLASVMIMSLIDDYGDEMVQCNGSWKRKIDDLKA